MFKTFSQNKNYEECAAVKVMVFKIDTVSVFIEIMPEGNVKLRPAFTS